jgi:hypothetical protein
MKLPKFLIDLQHEQNLIFANEEIGDFFHSESWGALFSPETDGHSDHRYVLWRIDNPNENPLVALMLNPSKATHLRGDRTVDGLFRRARRMGYGGLVVLNCFAFRATDPRDMKNADDPVGPDNDRIISKILEEPVDLLCAWGTHAKYLEREEKVKCLISSGNAKPHFLRLCNGGEPEHPLYIPQEIGLSPWETIYSGK